MSHDPSEVAHNEKARRFEIRSDGQTAFLQYELAKGSIALVHTEVPPALEGRGMGGALARAALEHARTEHLPVLVSCPFVAAFVRKHPEYEPLLKK